MVAMGIGLGGVSGGAGAGFYSIRNVGLKVCHPSSTVAWEIMPLRPRFDTSMYRMRICIRPSSIRRF